ncbi:hypothetical protein HPB47_010379 [Ixodes persulcatus]|uniref:Uncharacterized protein n=1 Tax=Ixodes persulcatus TaxID=34615 RepID=A0AC60NZI4_IXOPE|nr:hypothetical protein HPB47_010379 [Ixodes persulcatus]
MVHRSVPTSNLHNLKKVGGRCCEWVARRQHDKLSDIFGEKGSAYLNKNCKVCSDHFLLSDYSSANLESQGLKKFAVPSLMLELPYVKRTKQRHEQAAKACKKIPRKQPPSPDHCTGSSSRVLREIRIFGQTLRRTRPCLPAAGPQDRRPGKFKSKCTKVAITTSHSITGTVLMQLHTGVAVQAGQQKSAGEVPKTRRQGGRRHLGRSGLEKGGGRPRSRPGKS